jgi:acetamidase/formamidase
VRSKELATGTPGLVHHSRSAGLLPDDFPDPYIRVFDLTNGEFAYLRDDIAIPIEPFFGTMVWVPEIRFAATLTGVGLLRACFGGFISRAA